MMSGLVELFSQSLLDVGGHAVSCSRDELASTVAKLIEPDGKPTGPAAEPVKPAAKTSGATSPILVDAALAELAADLSAVGINVAVVDETVDVTVAGIGVTGALVAIADTGTVLIGPGKAYEGLLAALCPHHIVVLPANRIQPDLAAGLTIAEGHVVPGSRLVFVTGPSRTSDIELTPVVGVHGPLRLDVVIVEDAR